MEHTQWALCGIMSLVYSLDVFFFFFVWNFVAWRALGADDSVIREALGTDSNIGDFYGHTYQRLHGFM
jgi:hypothetical protein